MDVVYADQQLPEGWTSAIFLAGPTPRAERPVPSWRPEAIRLLEEAGYEGVVLIPESTDGTYTFDTQVEWERQGLNYADVILFWVPRDLETMPAFTTNVEFGRWVTSGKVVFGAPEDAPKNRYLDWLLQHGTQDHEHRHGTLEETVAAALGRIGQPQVWRAGGERCVPLHVWNTPAFRQWYAAQQAAGNRLDEAEVRWVFRMPKLQKVSSWVLWVKVWIAAEGRYKENEFVLSRTDISVTLLYHNPLHGRPVGSITLRELVGFEVLLVKEFRSPARTPDGFIHEFPGGSSTTSEDSSEVARKEVCEETGLPFSPDRFIRLGSRQVAATLSSHHAHAFAVELTEPEMAQAKKLANAGTTFGEEQDTELTYVEVVTVEDLLEREIVDWSVLGILFKGLWTRDRAGMSES